MKPPALINRTAAAVSAAAIFEIFPGSDLIGGQETEFGFFYQFFYSHPFPPEARNLLEEKIRQIIREGRIVREMEMVACSAKELFLKKNHIEAVNYLDTLEPKTLVSLIQIGSFIDLANGPFANSLQEIGAFQITSLKELENNEIRLEGTAFSTKQELKKFLRSLFKYSKENHLMQGHTKKLWQWKKGYLLWLEKGLKTRKNLVLLLKSLFGGQELKSSSDEAIYEYCLKRTPFKALIIQEKFENPEKNRGFFEEDCQSIFQQILFCSEENWKDISISLLQNIDKTLTMLGFHASVRLVGRRAKEKSLQRLTQILGLKTVERQDTDGRAEWVVEDGLGRPQTAFTLSISEERGNIQLRFDIGVEKILALLLEHTSEVLYQLENRVNRD